MVLWGKIPEKGMILVKKIIVSFLAGVVFATATAVYADEGLQKVEAYLRPTLPITLNGQAVTLESSPVMYDGSTYLKLRDVAALTNLRVNWNDATQTVELGTTQGGLSVEVTPLPTTKPKPPNTVEGMTTYVKDKIEQVNNEIVALQNGLESEENKQQLSRKQAELADLQTKLETLAKPNTAEEQIKRIKEKIDLVNVAVISLKGTIMQDETDRANNPDLPVNESIPMLKEKLKEKETELDDLEAQLNELTK